MNRSYRDEALNLSPSDQLAPLYTRRGVLVGLAIGNIRLPRPAIGMEHEHNIAMTLPAGERRSADDIGIEALLAAARLAGGWPARGELWPKGGGGDVYDRGRLVIRGPGGMVFHLYDDCSKLELSLGEFTSARRAMAFKNCLRPVLLRIIRDADEALTGQLGQPANLLVHLSGGDGESTCGSLHLNVSWNDRIARAAYVTLEAFDPLRQMLARQLSTVNSVAASGTAVPDGMLADARSATYGQVIGCSTLEPYRAMQFNRVEARSSEGFDIQGCGRNMQMIASFGQSQAANFIMLVLGQIEALRLALEVLGLYRPEAAAAPLLADGANLLIVARELARDMPRAARMHRAALDDYRRFTAWLQSQIGEDAMAELIPDWAEALALDEEVLSAIERNDTDLLVRTTDYAKKLVLAEAVLARRPGDWRANLQAIRNVQFAFASPQQFSPYHARFEANDRRIISDRDMDQAGPDPLTRGYFIAQVATRFADDPDFCRLAFDWDRISLRRSRTLSGGWIPSVTLEDKIINLPSPMGHNQPAVGNLFEVGGLDSLESLFDLFATRPGPPGQPGHPVAAAGDSRDPTNPLPVIRERAG